MLRLILQPRVCLVVECMSQRPSVGWDEAVTALLQVLLGIAEVYKVSRRSIANDSVAQWILSAVIEDQWVQCYGHGRLLKGTVQCSPRWFVEDSRRPRMAPTVLLKQLDDAVQVPSKDYYRKQVSTMGDDLTSLLPGPDLRGTDSPEP